MDKDLKEALEHVEHLAAALDLAYNDRDQITAKQVKEDIREAGLLLGRHGYRSDMAIRGKR